jgi:hypothetical protein
MELLLTWSVLTDKAFWIGFTAYGYYGYLTGSDTEATLRGYSWKKL